MPKADAGSEDVALSGLRTRNVDPTLRLTRIYPNPELAAPEEEAREVVVLREEPYIVGELKGASQLPGTSRALLATDEGGVTTTPGGTLIDSAMVSVGSD